MKYYLQPLASVVNKNNGYSYGDSSKPFQLLIDITTDSVATLDKLVNVLQQYPALIASNSVKFVITGNRPEEFLFTSYPSFIWFDGELFKNYSKDALSRIVMLSDDFKRYAQWKIVEKILSKSLPYWW